MRERGRGIPYTDLERAARHFGVSVDEVTPEMVEALPPRGSGLDTGRARGVIQRRISQLAPAGSTAAGLLALGIMLGGIYLVDRFATGKGMRWFK